MRSRPSAVLSALVLMSCLAAPASGQEKPSLGEILDSGRLEDEALRKRGIKLNRQEMSDLVDEIAEELQAAKEEE